MKTCTKCGGGNVAADFYTLKDGRLSNWCRSCTRENARQHHLARKDGRAFGVTRGITYVTKRCPTCHTYKPATREFFYGDANSGFMGADGVMYASGCKECRNRSRRDDALRIKVEVFSHYAGGTPACACCGETELVFLTIDHMDGDGAAHRRQYGARGSGVHFYRAIKRLGYPANLRVLCFNCNWGSAHGGCPHQKEREAVS